MQQYLQNQSLQTSKPSVLQDLQSRTFTEDSFTHHTPTDGIPNTLLLNTSSHYQQKSPPQRAESAKRKANKSGGSGSIPRQGAFSRLANQPHTEQQAKQLLRINEFTPVLKTTSNATPNVDRRKEKDFNRFLVPPFSQSTQRNRSTNRIQQIMNISQISEAQSQTGGPNVAIQVYLNTLREKIAKLQSEAAKKDKKIQALKLNKATVSHSDISEHDEGPNKELQLQTALEEVKILTDELKQHRSQVKQQAAEIKTLNESLSKAQQDQIALQTSLNEANAKEKRFSLDLIHAEAKEQKLLQEIKSSKATYERQLTAQKEQANKDQIKQDLQAAKMPMLQRRKTQAFDKPKSFQDLYLHAKKQATVKWGDRGTQTEVQPSSEVTSLKGEIERLNEQLKEFQQSLEVQKQQTVDSREQLSKAEDMLRLERLFSSEKKEMADEQIQNLQNEVKASRDKLEAAEASLSKLKATEESHLKEIEVLKQQIETQKNQMVQPRAQLQVSLNRKASHKKSLSDDFNNTSTEIDKLATSDGKTESDVIERVISSSAGTDIERQPVPNSDSGSEIVHRISDSKNDSESIKGDKKQNTYRNVGELTIQIDEDDSEESIIYGETRFVERKQLTISEYLAKGQEHATNFNAIAKYYGLTADTIQLPEEAKPELVQVSTPDAQVACIGTTHEDKQMFIKYLVDRYKELYERSKRAPEDLQTQEKISQLSQEHEKLKVEYSKVRNELDRVKQDAYTESVRIANDFQDAY